MKKVLVTGASGFLAGHLIPVLRERGIEVVGLARGSAPTGGSFTWLQGDVTNADSIRGAFRGVDTVFHLASHVALKSAERAELERTNIEGTRNVIDCSLEAGVRRLVHASSVVAVGAAEGPAEILSESSPNRLRAFGFPNVESKARSEKLVLDGCNRGLDAVIVNPSMVFGAGDARKAARKGTLRAARGQLPFYPSGGISVAPVRDVVQALIAAAERGRRGERYILSGENLTLKEVLDAYSRLAGKKSPRFRIPGVALRWAGGILGAEGAVMATLFHWYDCSKASTELGYRPGAALQAIEESVRWMRDNKLA